MPRCVKYLYDFYWRSQACYRNRLYTSCYRHFRALVHRNIVIIYNCNRSLRICYLSISCIRKINIVELFCLPCIILNNAERSLRTSLSYLYCYYIRCLDIIRTYHSRTICCSTFHYYCLSSWLV